MDYIWIDGESGEFIQDKARIADLLIAASRSDQNHLNILPRCANQSLLADLLQFLTAGDDNALIRRQHHMAVNTKRVSIVVMPSNGTVLAKANLELSLPHPSQGLIHIATVHVSCQFSPVQSPPLFHYHVENVHVVTPCPDESEILEMAYFLHDLPSQLTVEEEEAAAAELNYMKRDAFLRRTKTSWKQMNDSLAQKLTFRNSNTLQKSQANLKRQMERIKTAVSQPRVNYPETSTENVPPADAARLDRPDARTNCNTSSRSNNAGWKKQQESIKNQLNRFKASMGPNPSTERINTTNSPDAAHSRTVIGRDVGDSSLGVLRATNTESRTPNQADIFRPSWKQKQDSLRHKMNNLKSAVLVKAGSKAMSQSDVHTTSASDMNIGSNVADEKRQDAGEKPKWTGRLRTGWNRLAQSLPNKNNPRREAIVTAPSNESEELVFSATQSSDLDDGVLFDSPSRSPFNVKTAAPDRTSSTSTQTAESSSSSITVEEKAPPTRSLEPKPRANQSQRRWNSGRRFTNLLKIGSLQ
mmetsp:Transcript_4474/g.9400  ORF Transcript_4474/g.9400 Transcript_4474/m.9400 type:complete len:528 (+) Transcript_4474:3681-5264(+)